MKLLEDILPMTVQEYLPIMNEKLLKHISTYFGVPTMKNPCDWWCYQEIIHQLQPDFIIEIGTFAGGSALAMAHLFDAMGNGTIISVDITHKEVHDIVKQHPRVKLIEGDAIEMFNTVSKMVQGKVMVIEDSAHTYFQTLNVLNVYSPLVTLGQYFIVEDTVLNHGFTGWVDSGPYAAVQDFLRFHPKFESDRSREGFGITWNPIGFLKRKE